jgi:type I restriction enzyme S subunit
MAVGSTIKTIGLPFFKKLRLHLPPLPEQRKIADILSTWDRAIEKTESLLANARTQKRALMQSLLTGKRRFPAFEGQPWKEVRLGEMGQTVSGGTPASETTEYWDGDVHWATPTDITKLSSRFIYQTARMITEDGLKKSSAKLVPEGTILICTRATIGEMAIATAPICTNQGFKNLVLSADFNSDFVFYLLQFFKKELIRYACGSTFLELSKKDFDKRSFMVPSLEEQEQIASVLNDTEDQIDEHRKSITKLRTEKKALMQQLLTGKRRVHV